MNFLIKLVFRLTHITAGSVLIGLTFADAIWDLPRPSNYALVQSICGVFLLVSGIANLILLSPASTMGDLKHVWGALIKSKIVLWAFLLPFPELIAKYLGMQFPRRIFNQVLIVIAVLLSSYAKQYRDWAVLTWKNSHSKAS